MDISWNTLSEEERKKQLFEKQRHLLDTFLHTKAITKEQYDTSLHGLAEKMGISIGEVLENEKETNTDSNTGR